MTIHSPTTVGNGTLQMTANRYRGMTVRITRGHGAGQEQAIAANDGDRLDGIAGVGRGAGRDQFLRGGGERVAFRRAG